MPVQQGVAQNAGLANPATVVLDGDEVEENTERVADDGNWDGPVPSGPLLGGEIDPLFDHDEEEGPVGGPDVTDDPGPPWEEVELSEADDDVDACPGSPRINAQDAQGYAQNTPDDCVHPSDFLELLFSSEIFEQFVAQTNAYALAANKPPPSDGFLTVRELKNTLQSIFIWELFVVPTDLCTGSKANTATLG